MTFRGEVADLSEFQQSLHAHSRLGQYLPEGTGADLLVIGHYDAGERVRAFKNDVAFPFGGSPRIPPAEGSFASSWPEISVGSFTG
jgi:hypothetical protein